MHTSTPALADSRRPHAGMLSQASLVHQTDERLVTLARSGSERAWSEITRRYRRQLRSYCARFVGVSRSEDAVQQTFLQAFLALRDGAEREIALRAWLYRIAHNCSIDLLRKGTPDYDQLDLEYDGVAQPPTLFEQAEDVRRLVARMRDLPDAQRQALALRELEGRSYEEISAQIGHSGSGVRQLIFRARTTLRNGVAGFMPLGLLKARLTQPSAYDLHHVASAAAVPTSSGNGVETVSAATLAVVAVLGGGFAVGDAGSRRPKPPPAQTTGTVPVAAAAVASAPLATGLARVTNFRGAREVTVRLPRKDSARIGFVPAGATLQSSGLQIVEPIAPVAAAPPDTPVHTGAPVADVVPPAELDGVRRQPATESDGSTSVSGSGTPAAPGQASGPADAGTNPGAPVAPAAGSPPVPAVAPATPTKPQAPKAPTTKPQAPSAAQPPKTQAPKVQVPKKPGPKAPQASAPKSERR